MEEYIHNLVENTFKNYSIDKVKRIIEERISWYEIKLLNSISKDIIREKIKEQQDIIDENQKLIDNKINATYTWLAIDAAKHKIEVLEELLEE